MLENLPEKILFTPEQLAVAKAENFSFLDGKEELPGKAGRTNTVGDTTVTVHYDEELNDATTVVTVAHQPTHTNSTPSEYTMEISDTIRVYEPNTSSTAAERQMVTDPARRSQFVHWVVGKLDAGIQQAIADPSLSETS